ncbi:MAG TPA: amidase [Polyangiaceae bacterium]|nr:amidase [Polyangiaceae bacterium]
MRAFPVGRISGRTLDALVTAVRKTPARGVLAGLLRAELGIDALRALPHELRGPLPFSHAPLAARASHERSSQGLDAPDTQGTERSAAALAKAYRSGESSPVQVALRAFGFARELAGRVPTLGPLCGYDDARALRAAQDSQERITRGAARPLEGIPITVKEEIDLFGFPTRKGTGYAGFQPAAADALAVARLRTAGAVILGQTPMTEFGLSPLGANPHRRMPMNPHDTSRLAGGSSTGGAVAVSLGLCPMSLGTDGGGSIRIPAAHCGIFGLKPSYGRIPSSGLGTPFATSVVHLGPLARSSSDLARFLEVASGADPADDASRLAPAFATDELTQALGRGVRGLRIGVEPDEWSAASPAIRRAGEAALQALSREGATLVEVRSPLMRWAGAIGYLTLGIEGFLALARVRKEHMDELGLDVQLVLAGIETFCPDDYLDAQRLRSSLRRELAELLRDVDVLALPSTGQGPLSVADEEARYGFIDPKALQATCRFAFLANVSGLPAASAPVGLDDDGLPIGLQIIGDAWDEACVLQVLAHLERIGVARPPRPASALDLLSR